MTTTATWVLYGSLALNLAVILYLCVVYLDGYVQFVPWLA